jgi:hypothetical protein
MLTDYVGKWLSCVNQPRKILLVILLTNSTHKFYLQEKSLCLLTCIYDRSNQILITRMNEWKFFLITISWLKAILLIYSCEIYKVSIPNNKYKEEDYLFSVLEQEKNIEILKGQHRQFCVDEFLGYYCLSMVLITIIIKKDFINNNKNNLIWL